VTGSLVVGILGMILSPLRAGERSHAFVEGLRQRGYHDTALDYLDSMRTSSLADKSFLDVIDFEVGSTLVESARLLPLVDREKRLNEARNAFQKFITDHSQHWLATEASVHLANLLVDRGRVKMEMALRFQRTEEQKKQLATEARGLFQDAEKFFAVIDKTLAEKLKDYKTVDYSDEQRLTERGQLRTDTMQVRLALASMVYEIARTYEPGSKENKENLQAAAVKFEEFYKKYSRWVGGYYARIDEARCYQDLGDFSKAQTILAEVIGKKDYDEGFHRVRGAATVLAIQIALLPQVRQYKEAVEIYRNWEENIAQRAEASEEALAIKCLAGEAALESARNLKVETLQSLKERGDLLQLARNLLTFTARFPGDYRRRARVKLAEPLLAGNRSKSAKPKDFAEARDRGRIAWDRLRQRDLKPEEESQLRAEALENYYFALVHAPRDAAIDDLNTIRYYYGYLCWSTGEYYDTAVIGEFLARRYPNRPEAQQAAKLALAAYTKLVGSGRSGKEFDLEKSRMIGIAQFITERWPNSPSADEAWMILIGVAINDRDLKKMVEYLSHVSPDSPRRGETELLTGQTLWTAYLKAAKLSKAEQPTTAEHAQILVEARKLLEDGVERMRKPVEAGGEVTPGLAAAVLSLAQICLDSAQPEKAIAWLDDPEIGSHTLINDKHKVTYQGNFRVETLKATLRAYVAALALENLEECLESLEKNDDGLNVTHIYLGLARQLEASLKQLRAKDETDQTAGVTRGLTVLLSHLGARPVKETNFDVLNWVADTFVDLGAHLAAGSGKMPAEAIEHYARAAKTQQTLLEACRNDEHFAPDKKAIRVIQIRLAGCLRHIGQYGQAIDILLEVLRAQNTLIEAQWEAALIYQAWGEKKPGAYLYAIRGGNIIKRPDGETFQPVWGWGGIARRVESNDSLYRLYHQARYNLAFCRVQYALSKSGRRRTELLNQAQRDITVVYRLYPKMGGEASFNDYDALLKKIQRLLGVPENGLQPLEAEKSFDAESFSDAN
jgi:tetratricopeptide (TPR) repeat protein